MVKQTITLQSRFAKRSPHMHPGSWRLPGWHQ
jgi:hypothetical protein